MSSSWYTLRARGDQWLHEKVHVLEMHEIANEELDKRDEKLINEFRQMVYDVAESVIGSYSAIVRTCVKIGFKNGKDIFEDEKTQEIASRAICQAFIDEFNKKIGKLTLK